LIKIFVDTSALFAVLDADDINHEKAKKIWSDIIYREETLISTNYILIESFALVQRRLGFKALHALQENIVQIIHIEWIDQDTHNTGIQTLFSTSQRKLSLVDCISFITMRNLNINHVFTFDRHFKKEGFSILT
jgi:predicted nucleic acid-binding protein